MVSVFRRNAIDFIFSVFRVGGWMTDPNWSWRKKIIHRCYGVVAYSLVAISAVLQLKGVKERFSIKEYGSGFTAIAEVLGVFYSMFVTLLFTAYAKQLRDINSHFKEALGFALKYSPEITTRRYERSATHASLVVRAVLFAYELSVVLWSIMPIYDHLAPTPGKAPRYAFPWLTYGLDSVDGFWTIFSLQFGHGILATVGLALGFSFPPAVCTLVQGQISILTESLQMARKSESAAYLILPELASCSGVLTQPSDVWKVPQKESIDLRDCVIHHQLILRLLRKVKALLTPFLFFSIMYIQIILANIAVASASIDEEHSIILTGFEATLFSLQLFVESMYITNLTVACSEVSFVAYSVYLENRMARKDLQLMIFRSNQEEKFACLFTSSFRSRTVFKTLELVWNYFVIAKRMEEKLRHHLTDNQGVNAHPIKG